MSKKTIKVLIIVLIVVSTAAFYPQIKLYFRTKFPQKNISEVLVEKIDYTDIVAITITNNQTSVELRKTEGKWRVGEYFADETKISNFVFALMDVANPQLVSSNKENHVLFGIDDVNSFVYKLKTGQKEYVYTFGTAFASIDEVYFKNQSNDNVYKIAGPFRSYFFADEKSWRNKTLLTSDINSISKIEYKGTKNLVIEKNQDGLFRYKVNNIDKELAQETADEILAIFATIIVDDHLTVEQEKEYANTWNKAKLVAYNQDGGPLFSLNLVEKEPQLWVENPENEKFGIGIVPISSFNSLLDLIK